ncbi:MAG TPA: PDZ domain-containing protein [Smithella sp.]|nr:PDZ domain-containing protein [Smithella sp.]HRS97336.1 PDZ domain-containing protein [Smithella sp.]
MNSTITQTVQEKIKQMKHFSSVLTADSKVLKSLWIIAVISVLSFEVTAVFYKIVSIPLVSRKGVPVSAQSPSRTAVTGQDKRPSDYAIIAERNLFQSTLKPASLGSGGFFTSEQEKTDFDLKGTVAGPSSYSYVIIEEHGSKKQKLLKLGDKIGARELVKIARNAATFREGGSETTLRVKETVEGPLLSPSATPARRTQDMGVTLNPENIRDQLDNLKALMNQAVIRPFLNQGNQEGFIISNISPESIYAKMGLKNGDIIINANDQPLHSAGSLLHLVNTMQAGSNISLSIKREGKPQTIQYSFR